MSANARREPGFGFQEDPTEPSPHEPTPMNSVDDWKGLLRTALREALKEKRPHAVTAFRDALAALDDAEAVDAAAAPPVQDGVIAGGVAGLGAGDVPRRELSADEAAAILARELRERREAAASYRQLGRQADAEALALQAEALAALLPPS